MWRLSRILTYAGCLFAIGCFVVGAISGKDPLLTYIAGAVGWFYAVLNFWSLSRLVSASEQLLESNAELMEANDDLRTRIQQLEHASHPADGEGSDQGGGALRRTVSVRAKTDDGIF